MSTEFFNDQWRIPSNENQNKISNYSMEFDGTSDFVTISNPTSLPNNFTWSAWIYPTRVDDGYEMIYTQGTTFASVPPYFAVKDTRLHVYLTGVYETGLNFITADEWQHVAVTRTSGVLNLYRNGVEYNGARPVQNGTINNNSAGIIGKWNTSAHYFQGKIDQFCIFDYALSQDQITQLGAEGYAFNFIPNDRINVGNDSSLNITGALTLSIWMKSTSTAVQGLISKNGNEAIYALYVGVSSGNDVIYSWVSNDGSTLSSTNIQLSGRQITDGNWHNIIMVNDPTTTNNYLYVDGVEVKTSTSGTTIHSSTVDTLIGTWSTSLFHFNGELSNAQIFNSVIPPTGSNSVQTIYNNGKPLSDMSSFTSLQGWWKLDDTATFNSNWSIPDDSSNSNTGTSVGMNASNLVASNINGELISNPMATSPKPIAYYQLGDQSVDNGANYLVPNNSLSDYVFNFVSGKFISSTLPTLSNTQISGSLWVKPSTTLTTIGRFFSFEYGSAGVGNRLMIAYNASAGGNNQKFVIYNGSASIYTSGIYPAGNWYHVAWNFGATGGDSQCYINGNPVINLTTPASLNIPSVLYLNATNGSAQVFDGELSNVAVFNGTSLSQADVNTLYNNGSPSTDISSLNPTSWYKLNAADTFDGSNWTINDYGSGGNDGTSSGMTSANLVVSDLQQTSGYSPYALDFSGITAHLKTNTIPAATNTVTLSAWVKRTGAAGQYAGVFGVRNSGGSPDFGLCWQLCFLNNDNKIQFRTSSGVGYNYILTTATQNDVMPDNTWTHVVGVADGTNIKIYINGVLQTDIKTQTDGTLQTPTSNIFFGMQNIASSPFNGQLSNCARWNVGLTQAQVTEIYNQGVPSNLNTFSGTAPIGWWQLGSNSSFNPNPTGTEGTWTCLDEVVTDNAIGSVNMSNDDIVNGPGYSANGLGTSSIDIVGDAPYSTANGLSENMDVLDRVSGTGNVPG